MSNQNVSPVLPLDTTTQIFQTLKVTDPLHRVSWISTVEALHRHLPDSVGEEATYMVEGHTLCREVDNQQEAADPYYSCWYRVTATELLRGHMFLRRAH